MSYAVVMCITPASINEISRFYHATGSQLGWLYRVMMLGFFVAVIAGGRYADRRGKIPVMLAGCVTMSIGAFMFARTSDYTVVLAAMAFMGVGGGFAEGLASAIVSDLYGGARRTAMMNLSQLAFAVGAISSPFAVAKLLAAGINWRIGYSGAAVICAVSALIAVAAAAGRGEKTLTKHDKSTDWRELLSNKRIFWLCVGILLYVGAECGQANWLAVYFEKELGSTAPLAASSVGLFWLGIGAGRAAAAWVSKYLSDVSIIRWSLGLAAICQASILLGHAPSSVLAFVFVLGFCLGPVFPTILSRAGAIYPLQSGTLFGVVIAAGALGAAIFPPTIGSVADAVGMRTALWTCFVILIVNLGIFLRLKARN